MPYSPVTIAASWFIGEVHIPGATGSIAADVATQANIAWFIAKYQPDFLKKLLGETLYAEYVAAIATESHDSKWDDLSDQIYDTASKISPVANYVYFMYRRHHSTISVQTGEVSGKYENAEATANATKMVDAWNWMVDQVDTIREWIDEHSSDYTTYDGSYIFEKVNTLGI